MENKFLFLLAIPIIIIVYFFIISSVPLDRRVIPASFLLGERTGFDLSPGKLTFGKIEVNQSATRNIMVENKFKTPIKIYIKSSGEISKNIIVSENNFILNIQESKNITFSIYTKGLTEFREYNGEIEIISKKA